MIAEYYPVLEQHNMRILFFFKCVFVRAICIAVIDIYNLYWWKHWSDKCTSNYYISVEKYYFVNTFYTKLVYFIFLHELARPWVRHRSSCFLHTAIVVVQYTVDVHSRRFCWLPGVHVAAIRCKLSEFNGSRITLFVPSTATGQLGSRS